MSISRLDAIHEEIRSSYTDLRSAECTNYAKDFEYELTGHRHTDANRLTLTYLVEHIASGDVYNIQVRVSSGTYHWMIATLKDHDTVRIYNKWGCGIPTYHDAPLQTFIDYIRAYNDLNQLMHGKREQPRMIINKFCRDAAHNIVYDTIEHSRTNERFVRKPAENVSIDSLADITALLGRITEFEDDVYNHSYKKTYQKPERDSEVESDEVEELTRKMELLSIDNDNDNDNIDEAIESLNDFLHSLASAKAGVWLLIPAPAPPAGGRRKTRNKRRNRNKRTRRNHRRH